MFTGIIESQGQIKEIKENASNKTFLITSDISNHFTIDESVSHDGVCLTIEKISNGIHQVTAIRETLKISNVQYWQPGQMINLERSMLMNGRLDGHIVQGHVDTLARCTKIDEMDGSWQFTFQIDGKFAGLIIEKGSISVNGISLTIFDIGINNFTVAIIPYTYAHTNMKAVHPGMNVNIEFDLLGKYVNRLNSLKQ